MTNRDILDRAAQELSGGEFRLKRDDPDAGNKFLAFVGQLAGAAGRGALGAARFAGEGLAPVAQTLAAPFAGAGEAFGDRPVLGPVTGGQLVQGLDATGALGGAAAANTVAPFVSGEALQGMGLDVDPNAFDAFLALQEAKQQEERSFLDAITARASREAFRETEFAPGVGLALEVAGDPLNVLPGVGFAGGGGRALRALTGTGRAVRAAPEASLAARAIREASVLEGVAPAAVKRLRASQAEVAEVGRRAALQEARNAPGLGARISPVGSARAAGPSGRELDDELFASIRDEIIDVTDRAAVAGESPDIVSITKGLKAGDEDDILKEVQDFFEVRRDKLIAGSREGLASTTDPAREAGIIRGFSERIDASQTAAEAIIARRATLKDAGRVAGDLPEGVPGSVERVAGDIPAVPTATSRIQELTETLRRTDLTPDDRANITRQIASLETASRAIDDDIARQPTVQTTENLRKPLKQTPENIQEQIRATRARIRSQSQVAGALKLDDSLERHLTLTRIESDLRLSAPTEAAIVNMARQLREAAPPTRAQIEAAQSAARSPKVAAGARLLEAGQGQEAFVAARSQLGGEITPKFVAPTITADDLFLLRERIRTLPDTRFYSKLNTEDALMKILRGVPPPPRELLLLERAFGRDFVQAFLSRPKRLQNTGGFIIDLLSIPKTLRSAFDLSAPLRQGMLLGARNPREFGGAFKAMFRSISKQDAFAINKEIFDDPDIIRLLENGLFLHPVEGAGPVAFSAREEAFISRFASRIPGVGVSERTFGTFLNKLRADVAKKTMNNWRAQGINVTDDPARLKSLARFINVFTGRGSLGKAEPLGDWLNIGFWSPRLVAARFQTPFLIADPIVRRQVVENLAATFGVGMSILAVVKLSGLGTVEGDPRSSDFGKIVIGRTRIDFWGGFQPIFRYLAQLATGQRKVLATGEIQAIVRESKKQKAKPPVTRTLQRIARGAGPTAARFTRSKLAPGLPTLIWNEMTDSTFLERDLDEPPDRGRPPDVIEDILNPIGINTAREIEAVNQFAPLFGVDLVDVMEEYGLIGGTALAIPALFGVGVQTFNKPRDESTAGPELERATR